MWRALNTSSSLITTHQAHPQYDCFWKLSTLCHIWYIGRIQIIMSSGTPVSIITLLCNVKFACSCPVIYLYHGTWNSCGMRTRLLLIFLTHTKLHKLLVAMKKIQCLCLDLWWRVWTVRGILKYMGCTHSEKN